MARANPLATYQAMRDFAQSPEPAGEVATDAGQALPFVVQKHAARSLHYDFRLALDGTLKSWAIPKGPSLDPADKRMAVQVEDHPLSYADFEGTIPPKHYGAGTVIVWDRGHWVPLGDARAGLAAGKLKFELHGDKLHGAWTLVRMRSRGGERQQPWLLIKERDDAARSAAEYSVVDALPGSVLSGNTAAAAGSKQAAKPAAKRSSARAAERHLKPQPLPETLAPQLATLVDRAPPGADWLYELKFDGYRLLTRIEGREVRCVTRNGHDWSAKMPGLVKALRALKLKSTWLDGEIIVAADDGRPDFQALQNAFDASHTNSIRYVLFDLPFHAGEDLRQHPLSERRERLQALLAGADGDVLRFSESLQGDPASLLESATQAGLEGLIGKRAGATYQSHRSPDWIKLKTEHRQEFVIGGYTDPKGSRAGLGALLLGVHDASGSLRYAGDVGTGFDAKTLAALKARLAKIASTESPFADAPSSSRRPGAAKPHWVRPKLIAEVSFAQWTQTGRVRHAVFHGLRGDKPPRAITRELPARSTPTPPRTAARLPAGVRVTHADRVIDTQSGMTKGEVVAFYAEASALLLPHLKGRPVALLRAPAGVGGEQFFQKHADTTELPGVKLLDPALDPGHAALLEIRSTAGLLSAAQMNMMELHTWNSTALRITQPDRMVFDLDPGEGVAWQKVQEGAELLHALLDELRLASFLKTSGGKGLHVVVPLMPRWPWETVKRFSLAVVSHLAQVIPDRFVAKSGPRNRVGRIYVDTLRNGWGSTTAAAWSTRARPGVGVSVPVDWAELRSLASGAHWTLRNVSSRFEIGNEPWAGYAKARQGLSHAMKALSFNPKETSS